MSEIPPAVFSQSGKSECISFQNLKAKIKKGILCNFLRDIDIMRQIIMNRTPVQVHADVSTDHIKKVAIRAAVTLGALAFVVAGAAAACFFLLPALPIPIVPMAFKLVIALASTAFRCGQYAYRAGNKDKVNSEKTLDHRDPDATPDATPTLEDTKAIEPDKITDEDKTEIFPERIIDGDTTHTEPKHAVEAKISTNKDPETAILPGSLGEEIATKEGDVADDKPILALKPLASSMPIPSSVLKIGKEEPKDVDLPPPPDEKAESKVEVKSSEVTRKELTETADPTHDTISSVSSSRKTSKPEVAKVSVTPTKLPKTTAKTSAEPAKSKEDLGRKETLGTVLDPKKAEPATGKASTSEHKATVTGEVKDKKGSGKTETSSAEKVDKKTEKPSKISASEPLPKPESDKSKDVALSPSSAKKRKEGKVEKPATPTKAGEIKENAKKPKKISAQKTVDPLSQSTTIKRTLPPIIDEPTHKSEEKSKLEDDLSAELSAIMSAEKTDTREADSKINLDQLKAQILQQNEASQAVRALTNESKFSKSEESWLKKLRKLLLREKILSNDELQKFSPGSLQVKFLQQRLLLQSMSDIVSQRLWEINENLQKDQNLPYSSDRAFGEMRAMHAQIRIKSYNEQSRLLQPVQVKLQKQLLCPSPNRLTDEPIAWDLRASIERSIQILEAKKEKSTGKSEQERLQKQIDELRGLGKQKPGKLLFPQVQHMQKNLQNAVWTALNSVNDEIKTLPETGGLFGFFKKKDPKPDQLNDIKTHLENYQQQLESTDIQPQWQEQFKRLVEKGKQISISSAMLQQMQKSGVQPGEIAKMEGNLDLMLVNHLQQLRTLGQKMGLSKDRLPSIYVIRNLKNLPAEELVNLGLAQRIKSHIDQMCQMEHILHVELSEQQQQPIETIDRVQREMRLWLNPETTKYPEDNTEPGVLLRKLLDSVNGVKLGG